MIAINNILISGSHASIPSASILNQDQFYFAPDQSALYYSNGLAWSLIISASSGIGEFLPLTGGTLTGPLVGTNVSLNGTGVTIYDNSQNVKVRLNQKDNGESTWAWNVNGNNGDSIDDSTKAAYKMSTDGNRFELQTMTAFTNDWGAQIGAFGYNVGSDTFYVHNILQAQSITVAGATPDYSLWATSQIPVDQDGGLASANFALNQASIAESTAISYAQNNCDGAGTADAAVNQLINNLENGSIVPSSAGYANNAGYASQATQASADGNNNNIVATYAALSGAQFTGVIELNGEGLLGNPGEGLFSGATGLTSLDGNIGVALDDGGITMGLSYGGQQNIIFINGDGSIGIRSYTYGTEISLDNQGNINLDTGGGDSDVLVNGNSLNGLFNGNSGFVGQAHNDEMGNNIYSTYVPYSAVSGLHVGYADAASSCTDAGTAGTAGYANNAGEASVADSPTNSSNFGGFDLTSFISQYTTANLSSIHFEFGDQTIHYTSLITDTGDTQCIDVADRYLFAADGSTIILNFSSTGSATTSLVNLLSGSFAASGSGGGGSSALLTSNNAWSGSNTFSGSVILPQLKGGGFVTTVSGSGAVTSSWNVISPTTTGVLFPNVIGIQGGANQAANSVGSYSGTAISLIGGVSLCGTANGAYNGGAINITGGTNSGSSTPSSSPLGGSVVIAGGASAIFTGSAAGGNVTLTGGASSNGTTNTGGNVVLRGGFGNTSNGLITIGDANTSAINIGTTSMPITISGSALIASASIGVMPNLNLGGFLTTTSGSGAVSASWIVTPTPNASQNTTQTSITITAGTTTQTGTFGGALNLNGGTAGIAGGGTGGNVNINAGLGQTQTAASFQGSINIGAATQGSTTIGGATYNAGSNSSAASTVITALAYSGSAVSGTGGSLNLNAGNCLSPLTGSRGGSVNITAGNANITNSAFATGGSVTLLSGAASGILGVSGPITIQVGAATLNATGSSISIGTTNSCTGINLGNATSSMVISGSVTFSSASIVSGGTLQERFGSGSYGAILAKGEGYYDTASVSCYIGDGSTVGGKLVGGLTFLHNTANTPVSGATHTGAGGAPGTGWNVNTNVYSIVPGTGGGGSTTSTGVGGAGGSITSVPFSITGGTGGVGSLANGGAGGGVAGNLVVITGGTGGTTGGTVQGGVGGGLSSNLISIAGGAGGASAGSTGTGTAGAGGGFAGFLTFTGGAGGSGPTTGAGAGAGGGASSVLINISGGTAGAGNSSGGGGGGNGGSLSASLINVNLGNGGSGNSGGSAGNGSSITGTLITISSAAGGNASSIGAGGNAGSVGTLISVTPGAGSSANGGAGAAGGSVSTLIIAQAGSAGTNISTGVPGVGGTVNTLISAIAGNGGAGASSGTFGGGIGGNTGTITLSGGNGGNGTSMFGAGGGTGGSINLSGGAASNQFAGGNAGSFTANGGTSSGTATGSAAGSITLSGNNSYTGGSLTLSNGVNTITTSGVLGSQATITLPTGSGTLQAMAVTTYTPLSTSQSIDMSQGNYYVLNLGSASGNVTMSFSNVVPGSNAVIEVVQGATARNCNFPVNTIQAGGGNVTYTASGANNTDVIAVTFKDTTHARIAVTTAYS